MVDFHALRTLHWIISGGMRRAGYTWEERRTGELKIGLWRKSWRQSSTPRRLVLIPGFGDTPLSWLLVLGFLRNTVRRNFDEIVLFDFPGYAGFLSHERAFHSVELLKNSLFDILDSLRPHALLGHSLGGWLSALYATECAQKQRPKLQPTGPGEPYSGPVQLILVDSSGVFVDENESRELQNKFKAAIADGEKGFDRIREYAFARAPFWLKMFRPQIARFFTSEEIAQFVDSFEAHHLLTEQSIGEIRAQVWLIWGEKDTLIPPTNLPIWLKKLNGEEKRCRAVLIKNSGHSPQIEAPGTLAIVLSQVFQGQNHHLNAPMARRWWKLIETA